MYTCTHANTHTYFSQVGNTLMTNTVPIWPVLLWYSQRTILTPTIWYKALLLFYKPSPHSDPKWYIFWAPKRRLNHPHSCLCTLSSSANHLVWCSNQMWLLFLKNSPTTENCHLWSFSFSWNLHSPRCRLCLWYLTFLCIPISQLMWIFPRCFYLWSPCWILTNRFNETEHSPES